jgi:predicted metal-dependent phosphotriesterase family hydrolase
VTPRRRVLRLAGSALALKALDALDGLAFAQSPAAFPRGSIIRTLLADVNPNAVGATLFHEHLSLQDHNAYVPPRPSPAQLHYTEDVELVTGEIRAARADGLTCIVDAGHTDMGRSLESLRQIAKGSGVYVVASGGYYLDRAYPPSTAASSEDAIADDMVQQAARDRLGAFGEIGTSESLTVNERKVFRAVGEAQVRTGLPVFTHNALYKAEAEGQATRKLW